MMLKCPKCQATYEDGYATCSDCHVNLLPYDENDDDNENDTAGYEEDPIDIVFLTHIQEEYQATYLLDILALEDIPVLTKDPAGGGFQKLYMGRSAFGVDLYVKESQFDAAVTIIKDIDSSVVLVENELTPINELDDTLEPSKEAVDDILLRTKRIQIFSLFIVFPTLVLWVLSKLFE